MSRVYFFGICVVYSKTMIHLNVVVSESNLLLDSNICTEQLFEKVELLLQMQMKHLFSSLTQLCDTQKYFVGQQF